MDSAAPEGGTPEKKRRPLSLVGKTLIIAFLTLVLLICTDGYLAAKFGADVSMIIIPASEITWTTIGFISLLYGCISQKPQPLAFPLLAWIPSMLMRFVGILMFTMMAFFPDSYTAKLHRFKVNIEESEVRKIAINNIALSLALGAMEITTTVYTLLCRYHLKEISTRRRRRGIVMRRRQRRSADRSDQGFDNYPLNTTGTDTTGDERTRSSTPAGS